MILDRHVNTIVVMGSVKDEVSILSFTISMWVCVCVCVYVNKKTSPNN